MSPRRRNPRPELPTLAATVREALGVSWGEARRLCATGKVSVDGSVCVDPTHRVEPDRVRIDREAPRVRKGDLSPERWVHSDDHLVVVSKPPGVLSVPHAGERDTLLHRVRAPLGRGRGKRKPFVEAVHRIDKGTSGLLVFARSEEARDGLKRLFARHAIDRGYVAIAHGAVSPGTHVSWLLRDRGDGLRGSWGRSSPAGGEPPSHARRAVTHVRASRRLRGASLVEIALETGRQHQIRIHLAEAGHPLVGEQVYVRDFEGKPIAAPRAMLHAFRLGFVHPITGERLCFERPPPGDFMAALHSLGGDDQWRPPD